jgi:hypothetical protein
MALAALERAQAAKNSEPRKVFFTKNPDDEVSR